MSGIREIEKVDQEYGRASVQVEPPTVDA